MIFLDYLNAKKVIIEISRYFEEVKIPENITMLNVQKDIILYYKQANFLLNLSRVDEWVETFGLTIIEAMAFWYSCHCSSCLVVLQR